MKTQSTSSEPESTHLRQKAEEELKNRKPTETIVTEVDTLRLIHELQVHQIELEMQNDEMAIANNQAIIAIEKYVDLYDFAPAGYLTLSKDGSIVGLNFSAATLLGKERSHLKNRMFSTCLNQDSIALFNEFIELTFKSKSKNTCELAIISPKTQKTIWLHIDATIFRDSDQCLLNMVDITERKQLEDDLSKKTKELESLNNYFLGREMRMKELKEEINALLIKSGCEKQYLL
jgi:PAS domain S-box-containing protein